MNEQNTSAASGRFQRGSERSAASSLRVEEAPAENRADLVPIVDAGFTGLYGRHARRTLRSVRWVTKAIQSGRPVGLTMFTIPGEPSGYISYVVVVPSHRRKGVGGLLLDDALRRLRDEGAREIFASVRTDNLPSIRLFQSRGFAPTSFRNVARSKGFARAIRLWRQMVVVPGERVFAKVLPP